MSDQSGITEVKIARAILEFKNGNCIDSKLLKSAINKLESVTEFLRLLGAEYRIIYRDLYNTKIRMMSVCDLYKNYFAKSSSSKSPSSKSSSSKSSSSKSSSSKSSSSKSPRKRK